MGFTITIVAAFLALIWGGRVKNRTTQFAAIMLAVSSLLEYAPFIRGHYFGYYFFIFFSFFAAIECFNSLRLKSSHRAYFVLTASVIAFFELARLLSFPYHIPTYPFAITYLLLMAYFWFTAKRIVFSRFGILIVWAGLAIKWLVVLL